MLEFANQEPGKHKLAVTSAAAALTILTIALLQTSLLIAAPPQSSTASVDSNRTTPDRSTNEVDSDKDGLATFKNNINT